MQVAENFCRRRVEKNIIRQRISELSGVPLSTVARFEQKGLIAVESLVRLAMALGYTTDIRNLFGTAKFNTMEELDLIRRKTGDKRAYAKNKKKSSKLLPNTNISHIDSSVIFSGVILPTILFAIGCNIFLTAKL